jgi:hypothetical protein
MAAMLWAGMTPTASAVVIAVLVALSLAGAAHCLLPGADGAGRDGPLFVVPHGAVIFIGAFCFLSFLAEGAILDWSALLLTAEQGLDGGG